MTVETSAYYLYCLAPAGHALQLNETAVFVRDCQDITAVLSQVPREEFCGEDASARFEDLLWLAPRACRHEAVVEDVMQQAPVLPARFATLFTSLDSLQGFLTEYHTAITGFFADLGRQREWAVKGMLDRPLATQQTAGLAPSSGSPGRDYLQRKRGAGEAREGLSRWLRTTCGQAAGELQRHASAFRERKPLQAAEGAEVTVNWAFLVPGGGEADFRQAVRTLDAQHSPRGLSFVLSGPWPPYSFAPPLGSEVAP